MSRTMFPFNDTFLATFNGTLLPSQSISGEITAMEFQSFGIQKIDLADAPSVPSWRKKGAPESGQSQFSETTSTEVATESASQTSISLQKKLPAIDKNGESNMKPSINSERKKLESGPPIKTKTDDAN